MQPTGNFRHRRNYQGDQLLKILTARAGTGTFSVVSQISPSGGWSFDDLAILDVTDSDQWLLMVAQPQGNDVVIYRKLYRGPTSQELAEPKQ